jgi:hypothetical protein
MDARNDPVYLRLYQEYARAIQAFENATRDRRRVRDRLTVSHQPVLEILDDWMRRPVGAPLDARFSAREPETLSTPRPPPEPRRFYLGPILGWYKVNPTPTPDVDPVGSVAVDVEKLYDEMSLHVYWSEKARYEKSKRAFFDYVRRNNIETHMERATNQLKQGANLQLLGSDDDDEDFMNEARREVEALCRNAWAIYTRAGTEKTDEVKVLLLQSIAEATLVGLESRTMDAMQGELERLVDTGEVSAERKTP